MNLERLERRAAPGYLVMRWKRPQPGISELKVKVIAAGAATCSVAAFVRSPLRLKVYSTSKQIAMGEPIDFPITILDHEKTLTKAAILAQSFSPATSVRKLARDWKKGMQIPENSKGDNYPEEVARALAVRWHLLRTSRHDPFNYLPKKLHLIHPKLVKAASESPFAVRIPTVNDIDGTYNLRLVVQGRTKKGCPFVRVGFHSVLVGK